MKLIIIIMASVMVLVFIKGSVIGPVMRSVMELVLWVIVWSVIGPMAGHGVSHEDISWDWKILLPKVLISMGYIRFTTKVRNMPLKE